MSLALYEAGEHVLAYHASALYEAKVLQTSRTAAGGWSYLIHYAGWKSTWDEWAPPERLLPLTDANRERAKMLSEALRAASGKKRGGGSTGGGTRKSASNGAVTGGSDDALDSAGVGVKRRRIDVSRETEDDGAPAAAIGGLKLALPFPLKRILVDDWDFVTQRHMLLRVPLPSTVPSVASILDGYLAQVANSEAAASAVCNVGANKSAKKSAAATARVAATAEAPTAAPSSSTVVNDVIPGPTTAEGTGGNLSTPAPGMATATAVVEGIRSYFDRALSTFLLYRFERPQYDALIRAQRAGTDAPRMSQLYGCAHLLRLFVKLPELVEASFVSQAQADALSQHLNDVLKYINKNATALFAQEHYAKASAAYLQSFESEMRAA